MFKCLAKGKHAAEVSSPASLKELKVGQHARNRITVLSVTVEDDWELLISFLKHQTVKNEKCRLVVIASDHLSIPLQISLKYACLETRLEEWDIIEHELGSSSAVLLDALTRPRYFSLDSLPSTEWLLDLVRLELPDCNEGAITNSIASML